jgi:hypothetical protein
MFSKDKCTFVSYHDEDIYDISLSKIQKDINNMIIISNPEDIHWMEMFDIDS